MDDFFQIKLVQPNNKGLIAKKNIQQSQEILECEPVAWATLQSAKKLYCNWCLLQKQVFKCSKCKCFYYCSTECQKQDWKYHKIECKMYGRMCQQKKISIDKQITTQFVLNVRLYYILQMNKQLSAKFYSMCSLEDYQPLERRQYFQELSVVLMENLGIEKNQSNMSQLIKQFNIVAINAFTVQDLFYKSDGVAVAIYWPANYFNHACNPNCTQMFDGRYLKIISNQSILTADQLTISYTNALELQKIRSKFLKEHYFFLCFCELCQVQKMIQTQYAFIKCPSCKLSAIRKQTNLKLSQDEQNIIQNQNQSVQFAQHQSSFQCTNCLKPVELAFLKKMAEKIQAMPEKIEKLQTYKLKKKELLSMKNQFDLKHPAFCKVFQTVYLHAVGEALISDNYQNKNKLFHEANILLNEILKNLTEWYKTDSKGLESIRFFSKFNQMSKLAYNMKNLPKCLQNLQKALKCIEKLSLRHKYKQIEELKIRYNQIKIQISIAKTKAMK